MQVHNPLFNCVNRTMIFWTWINITSVEIYAICIDSIMSSRDSIWIKYGNDVKNELVSNEPSKLCVLSYLINNSSHHMRARHLSWMNSCSNYDALFITIKPFRFLTILKQIFIFERFLLIL